MFLTLLPKRRDGHNEKTEHRISLSGHYNFSMGEPLLLPIHCFTGTLLYESGYRNQEIMDLKIKNFVTTGADAELYIVGRWQKSNIILT